MINFYLSDQRSSYCIRVLDTNWNQFRRFVFLPLLSIRCAATRTKPRQSNQVGLLNEQKKLTNTQVQTNKQTNAKHFPNITKVHCPKTHNNQPRLLIKITACYFFASLCRSFSILWWMLVCARAFGFMRCELYCCTASIILWRQDVTLFLPFFHSHVSLLAFLIHCSSVHIFAATTTTNKKAEQKNRWMKIDKDWLAIPWKSQTTSHEKVRQTEIERDRRRGACICAGCAYYK